MTTLSLKNDDATEVAQLLIDQVGTDEVATSKITLGAAGVDDGFVSSANPLPVSDAGGSLTVDNATLSVAGGGVEATALRVTLASDSTGVLSVDDNGASLTVDNAALAVTGGGGEASALRVTIASDSTGVVSIDDNGGAITVDNGGTFAVQAAQSGKWDITNVSGTVSLPTGAATAAKQPALGTAGTASADVITVQGIASMTPLQVGDNSGSLTVDAPVGTPVFVRLSDGSAAISTLPVSLASVPSHAVTNAGTFAVQVDGTALTRLTDIETNTDSGAVVGNGAAATAQRVTLANDSTGVLATLTTLTGGGVAHDSADSGNPHKVGAKATTSLAGETMVASGDRTDLRAGSDGVLIVRPGYSLEDVVQARTTDTGGTSTDFTGGLAAPGAGVRLWITNVDISNSSSSFCTVDLRDGAAGSVLWTLPVPATGGVVKKFDPPLKLTANTALAFDVSAATSTITISANGFKSKV